MRKYLLALGMTLLMTSPAFSAGYGDAGCGLGSLIFGKTPGGVQILAATTNGTSQNQSFAITSGTSNCDKESALVVSEADQLRFADANFASLAKESAAGQGEQLTALAGLMGCSMAAPEFARFTQRHYDAIFATDHTTPSEMLGAIKDGMIQDPVLAASCNN